MRRSEKYTVSLDVPDGQKYVAVYSLKANERIQAGLSIGTTLLVCIVLGSGAMLFSKITTDLVITPIEDMVQRVHSITDDPLKAAHQEEERLLIHEMAQKEMPAKEREQQEKAEKERQMDADGNVDLAKEDGPLETAMLEVTLNKIGALLALGFGEAGSKIVAQNIKNGEEVNPMLPGLKIMSIFGFCDIRNFTDATEVLQEGVMLFVNEIGEIVHGVVDRYSGAANKNIGDAFLLVWKFEEADQITDPDTGELHVKECGRVS